MELLERLSFLKHQQNPSTPILAAVKQALYLTALRLMQNNMNATPLLQALGIKYALHPDLLRGCQLADQPTVDGTFTLRNCLEGKYLSTFFRTLQYSVLTLRAFKFYCSVARIDHLLHVSQVPSPSAYSCPQQAFEALWPSGNFHLKSL